MKVYIVMRMTDHGNELIDVFKSAEKAVQLLRKLKKEVKELEHNEGVLDSLVTYEHEVC